MKKTGRFVKQRSKKKSVKIIGIILLLFVLGVAVLLGRNFLPANEEKTLELPWEVGEKPPESYTWEEFEALKDLQKDAFFESFESAEAFDAWMVAAGAPTAQESQPIEKPWEQGGKKPSAYTWEEFEALSPELQEAFFEAFDSAEAFDKWKGDAGSPAETMETIPAAPWEQGGKQPSDYTWEEYQNLPDALNDAFFESFDSEESFSKWLNHVNPRVSEKETEPVPVTQPQPWENSGKENSEYTWDEFLALSPEQQEEFFLSFATPELFEEWMNGANPDSVAH